MDRISDIDPLWLIAGIILCVLLFDVIFFTLVWGAIFSFALWAYYVLERDFTTAHAQSAAIEAWPYVAAAAFVFGLIGKVFRL